jgi:hypothetical protein
MINIMATKKLGIMQLAQHFWKQSKCIVDSTSMCLHRIRKIRSLCSTRSEISPVPSFLWWKSTAHASLFFIVPFHSPWLESHNNRIKLYYYIIGFTDITQTQHNPIQSLEITSSLTYVHSFAISILPKALPLKMPAKLKVSQSYPIITCVV